MTQLSPEGRALFRHARQALEPTREARERNARALAGRVGIGAGALAGTLSAASTAAASSSAAGSSLLLVAGKWLAVGLLVGGSVVSGAAAVRSASTPVKRTLASVQRASQPSRATPATPSAAAAPSAVGSGRSVDPERTLDSPPAPSTPPPAIALSAAPTLPKRVAPPPNVTEEAALLRRADQAIQTGSAATALRLLDELTREIPHGVLMEERSAERITALCQLGRVASAHDEAARFLSATPSSPLAQRVKASCGLRNTP